MRIVRDMLAIAAVRWACLTQHWPVGMRDIALRDPVCRECPVFHEMITINRKKKSQVHIWSKKVSADSGIEQYRSAILEDEW